jgi:hypothetical protein
MCGFILSIVKKIKKVIKPNQYLKHHLICYISDLFLKSLLYFISWNFLFNNKQ